MKRALLRWSVGCCATIVLVTTASPAAAQETLSGARDLYAAAAYDEALALLNRLRASERPADEARSIEQYRAFCLLALGHPDEAERAIEAVVTAQPLYRPEADMSPRVRQAFIDVRRRMLPAVVQNRYVQAKALFERKEFAAAAAGFKLVIDVLSDPDVGPAANQSPLSDVRMLAAGFHELSEKAAAPPPPLPAVPLEPQPLMASKPAAPHVYGSDDSNVTAPVPVQQSFPPYPSQLVPPSQGVLEVVIDEAGAVESATMITPVNPAYDTLALAAAKTWLYKPALLNGLPVKYRKAIQLVLKPTR